MENTFNNIPFLRITVAFATGIYLTSVCAIPSDGLMYAALLLSACLVITHKQFSYNLSPLFGTATFALLLLIGALTYTQHNQVASSKTKGLMAATVLETPQERERSYRSLLLLHSIKTDDSIIGTREKIQVYFEKSENIKQLKPGSQIIFDQQPQQIENRGNPYEFNYKKYLINKHIFRQVYLSKQNWRLTGLKKNSVLVWAESIRDKLLKIYRDQKIGEQETNILSALTLGYKRELKRETKQVFSSAGAMHVLAVSGLHVGILFFTFTYCFGFLQKRKTGRFIYVVLAVGFLWCYALITGFSPSVLRACTMFSLIIIASNINRRANIYNTLAASACLLLVFNPNNLFEVGFQLSYMAVFGIVFLQPRIAGFWKIENKVGLFFWNLITVSVAAQIATFPLSAYYFHQFPTYFLLSNIVVIPAAMLLIPLGLGLLIFSPIPGVATVISFLLKWIIKIVYFVLSTIESLPISTPGVVIHQTELFVILAILFSIFLFINNPRAIFVKSALLLGVLFLVMVFFSEYKQINKREIIVLNDEQPIVCFIKARKIYIVSRDTLLADDYSYSAVQNIKSQKRLTDAIFLNSRSAFRDKFLFLENGLAVFEGKKVLLESRKYSTAKKIIPNYIVCKTPVNSTKEPVCNDCLHISYYPQRRKTAALNNQHILSVQGAFIASW